MHHGFYLGANGEQWHDKDICGVDMSGHRKIMPTDRYILMQYTGRIDVMTNYIYEDDILEANWGQLFRVYWATAYYGWVLMCADMQPTAFAKLDLSLFKVVGNIHQRTGLFKLEYTEL